MRAASYLVPRLPFAIPIILGATLVSAPMAAATTLFPWQGIDVGPGGFAQAVRDLDGDGLADIVAGG